MSSIGNPSVVDPCSYSPCYETHYLSKRGGNPMEYLSKHFAHPLVLLSAMLDSGCILTGQCARGYFEASQDTPVELDFCLPSNYDSIVRMLSALTHCGVAFRSSWDSLCSLLTAESPTITISVAELIKSRTSRDLGSVPMADLEGCTFGNSGVSYVDVGNLMATIYDETLLYVNKTTGSNLQALKELSNVEQEVRVRRLGTSIEVMCMTYTATSKRTANHSVITGELLDSTEVNLAVPHDNIISGTVSDRVYTALDAFILTNQKERTFIAGWGAVSIEQDKSDDWYTMVKQAPVILRPFADIYYSVINDKHTMAKANSILAEIFKEFCKVHWQQTSSSKPWIQREMLTVKSRARSIASPYVDKFHERMVCCKNTL
ncbi:hypothetical protein V8E54_005427 [Elaphomyces granulatus]